MSVGGGRAADASLPATRASAGVVWRPRISDDALLGNVCEHRAGGVDVVRDLDGAALGRSESGGERPCDPKGGDGTYTADRLSGARDDADEHVSAVLRVDKGDLCPELRRRGGQ